MCGIAGIVQFDRTSVDSSRLSRMSDLLKHRGPDGAGVWLGDNIGLVHRRLSIIDLNGSAQPMKSFDENVVLTFNGEILNYRELRKTIDYPYRTAGDTEVILAAHNAYGDEAPSHLHGQFAYALYDRRARELRLVRDRMGILPLYWCKAGSSLIFASDINTLLAGLGYTPGIDPSSLASYLERRAVPAPKTLLQDVHKLEPGHYLAIDAAGTTRDRPYWGAAYSKASRPRSFDRAVDELDGRLADAVSSSLVADVPVGAYLSGGVDSSLIAAKAVQVRPNQTLHTFCAEFGQDGFDESNYAAIVSQHLGTTHHVVPVRYDDFRDLWEKLSLARGAPLSEPADVAVYKLALQARNHVKVVLSGEGSDELFAGYPKHRYANMTSKIGFVPTGVRQRVLTELEARVAGHRRLRIALRALSEPTTQDRLRAWFAPFTSSERVRLLGASGTDSVQSTSETAPLHQMLLQDLQAWLPDNLLERGDRMTMAASVELRPPFLDENVVDYALSLPPRFLVNRGQGKRLVKEVARRYLPEQIVNRPKAGFRVPLNSWFHGGLREFAWDQIMSADSVAAEFFSSKEIKELFTRHQTDDHDESIRIWTLVSLEVWYRSLQNKSNRASVSEVLESTND